MGHQEIPDRISSTLPTAIRFRSITLRNRLGFPPSEE